MLNLWSGCDNMWLGNANWTYYPPPQFCPPRSLIAQCVLAEDNNHQRLFLFLSPSSLLQPRSHVASNRPVCRNLLLAHRHFALHFARLHLLQYFRCIARTFDHALLRFPRLFLSTRTLLQTRSPCLPRSSHHSEPTTYIAPHHFDLPPTSLWCASCAELLQYLYNLLSAYLDQVLSSTRCFTRSTYSRKPGLWPGSGCQPTWNASFRRPKSFRATSKRISMLSSPPINPPWPCGSMGSYSLEWSAYTVEKRGI